VGVEQLEKRQARSWLSQYLNPTIVEEMVKNPLASQPGGRRFEITVLFSDIRGFTSVSENLDPEKLVELLNEYFSEMSDIILRNDGTVDKFLGDGILAFFGAPQPSDDHPKQALRAALEMRDRLEYLQGKWQQVTQTALRIGIGINSGEAMVGNIGSGRRMEYTIIGSTVNLASRIQNLTVETNSPILISGSTRAGVLDIYELRSLGPTSIRGLDQKVDLYEVLSLKQPATE
jgi:adenylate cyclase